MTSSYKRKYPETEIARKIKFGLSRVREAETVPDPRPSPSSSRKERRTIRRRKPRKHPTVKWSGDAG
jgi:hypothetical protein